MNKDITYSGFLHNKNIKMVIKKIFKKLILMK